MFLTHFNINYHNDILYFEYQKLNKELWSQLEKGFSMLMI